MGDRRPGGNSCGWEVAVANPVEGSLGNEDVAAASLHNLSWTRALC